MMPVSKHLLSSSLVKVAAAIFSLVLFACTQETAQRSTRAPAGEDGSQKKPKKDANEDDGWPNDKKDKPGRTDINDKKDEDTDEDTDEDEGNDNADDQDSDNTDNGDSDVKTSGGKGGATGLQEVSFRAANGQNSSYKINAPADTAQGKAYGLHIHLHGDGGGGYRDFPNKELRKDLIGVTVKAPNRNLQWGRSEGEPHAAYVQDLIQNELLKKYNIRLDRIYFSGVSGGAYFLTGSFIPQFGQHYNSGAFILCGGEAPRVQFAEPDMLKKFKIYWQVTAGERSDISANTRQSIGAYERALTQVLNGDSSFDRKTVQDSEVKGPGGHCEFDDRSYTTGIQFMIDTKFDVVVTK
jgi:hypothetical protein